MAPPKLTINHIRVNPLDNILIEGEIHSTDQTTAPQEVRIKIDENGLVKDGVWVEISSSSDPSWDKYHLPYGNNRYGMKLFMESGLLIDPTIRQILNRIPEIRDFILFHDSNGKVGSESFDPFRAGIMMLAPDCKYTPGEFFPVDHGCAKVFQ